MLFAFCTTLFGQNVNSWYPANRAPLKATKFVVLPVMAVKPDGWLLSQLKVMANGLTGYLYATNPDWSNYITNSAWRGGSGDRMERGPYYCDGLFPLAYLLGDTRLIAESSRWVNTMLSPANDWFAKANPDDIFSLTTVWKALRSWYEATGEKDSATFYPLTRKYFRLLDTVSLGSSW